MTLRQSSEILDLGIPITIQSTADFPSFHLLSGLFMGFKENKMVSVILSDNIKNEIKKAPTFDAFVFTNVGILIENYKCFNKILTRFYPRHVFNQYDQLLLKGKFTFLKRDDLFYDAKLNQLRCSIKFPNIKATLFYRVPGYRFCESQNIEEYKLPLYVEDEFPLNKGEVLLDGEYRITFMDWFNDHVDVDIIKESIVHDIKLKYELASIRRKKLDKRNWRA